ncbi:MAG: hypothetical protein Q9222_006175, partial [Ikaeria aurantiellina]
MKRKQAAGKTTPAKKARSCNMEKGQSNPKALQEKVQSLSTFSANLQDCPPATQDGFAHFNNDEYKIVRAADAIATLISLKAKDRAVATTYRELPDRIQFDFAIEQKSTIYDPVFDKELDEYLGTIEKRLLECVMHPLHLQKTLRYIIQNCKVVIFRQIVDLVLFIGQESPSPNPKLLEGLAKQNVTRLWDDMIFKIATCQSTRDDILKGTTDQQLDSHITDLYDLFRWKLSEMSPGSRTHKYAELVLFAWYLTNKGQWMLPGFGPGCKARELKERDLKRRDLIKRLASACESCKGLKDFMFWKQKINKVEKMVFHNIS